MFNVFIATITQLTVGLYHTIHRVLRAWLLIQGQIPLHVLLRNFPEISRRQDADFSLGKVSVKSV